MSAAAVLVLILGVVWVALVAGLWRVADALDRVERALDESDPV